MTYADLASDPVGTPHHRATCCWCQRPLVIGEVDALRVWVCPAHWARQVNGALTVQSKKGERRCLYVPLPSQVLFEESPAKNVLWGGQAGPGKSHGIRWWLYKRSVTVPGHESLLTRENWEQLDKTHLRKMAAELPLFGAKLVDRTARFPNGSFIDCGHMADAEAVSRYLSTEYGAIVCDEATQTPVTSDGTTPLAELSTRARHVYRDTAGNVVRPRFLPVSNPGGPSAAWLRDMFVHHTPDLEMYPKLKPVFDDQGVQIKGYRADQWAYIPAKLDDNPYQDEEYEETLSVLRGYRYEQLRNGDWDIAPGAFFEEWSAALHVRSLLNGSWSLRDLDAFGSMDWGYNSPGCFLVWLCLPDGHYHIVAEHKFRQKSAEQVADECKTILRELGLKLRYIACDPSMKAKTGHAKGEAIMETLSRRGLPMQASDNDRINGWLRVHELLQVAPDGTPWLTVEPSCRYLIRSLPAQMSDKKNPEDIDTGGDDHAVDALRYGAMSRPSPTRLLARAKKLHPLLEEAIAGSGQRTVLGAESVRSRVA